MDRLACDTHWDSNGLGRAGLLGQTSSNGLGCSRNGVSGVVVSQAAALWRGGLETGEHSLEGVDDLRHHEVPARGRHLGFPEVCSG